MKARSIAAASVTLLLGLSGHAPLAARQAPPAQGGQARVTQADAIVRLLTDLETALAAGRQDDVRALLAPAVPEEQRAVLTGLAAEGPASVTVRERDRQPLDRGAQVLVEMFMSRGARGSISTWQFDVQARADGPDRFAITGLARVGSVDGLVRLALSPTRQYAMKDLTFSAPDLTVHFASGSAFVAEAGGGVTAVVLRGKGTMKFTPPEIAEQTQLRAFAGHPDLEAEIDAAFIRLHPGDFDERFPSSGLQPVKVDPAELQRARSLFAAHGNRSYNLDLGDLASERWSLLPPFGDMVAELRTRRFSNLTYVRSASDPEDISLFDRQRGRNLSVYASKERLAQRGTRFFSEDEDATYDVEHYAIDVRFDPAREWLSGRGAMRVRTRALSLNSLSFKLAESLTVSSVSSPTFGRLLALRVAGQSNVIVSLPKEVPRGTELVLQVSYSGRLASQSLEREAIAPEGQIASSQQGAQPSESTVIPPEPRFMYSTRSYWYPQAPVTDYATAAIQITLPAQFQVVASGSPISNTVAPAASARPRDGEAGAERTVQFLADRPIRYAACVISRFVPVGRARADVPLVAAATLEGSVGPAAPVVNLDVISTPRQARGNRQIPARLADMMQFYAQIVGEAPYPDLSLAVMDAELPGGHSPAFFAVWHQPTPTTPYSWRNDPVAFDAYPFFFLAHEVAHQWWGQAIGWKNYHEQWLSEGLAQYFAALYAGRDRGAVVERALFAQMRQSALSLSDAGPIYLGYRLGHIQGESRLFRGLVYNKSAIVLHMLRRFIGDEPFLAGLRRYYRAHRFDKAGTDDLRKAFEAEAGRPLERFFERWILGAALPKVRLTWRSAPEGEAVVVRLEQTGDPFDFPLLLTLHYLDGQTEQVPVTVTTSLHETRIPLKGQIRRVDARDDLGLVNIAIGNR